MNILVRAALALVLTTVGATSAMAQAALPARTEVITVKPPQDWVQSVWQGGTVELGEFTPVGQTGPRFVDLLGYSVIPRTPQGGSSLADLRRSERADAPKGCRASRYMEQPAADGWVGLARICIGRDGEAADVAELEFATTTITDQGIYRVWRTHRAPMAEVWARSGRPAPAPDRVSQAEFEALVAATAPAMSADLQRREICDMVRPQDCHAFAQALPAPFEERFQDGYVAAVHLPGLNQISRERFQEIFGVEDDGKPNRVIVGLNPERLDWDDAEAVRGMLTALAWGHAADGAVLAILDPEGTLTEADKVRLRVRLINSARQLMKVDRPQSIVTIAIPTAS